MLDAKYDAIADEYKNPVLEKDSATNNVLDIAAISLVAQVGDVAGNTLLDVGCGTGTLALHWAKAGATVTGFDLSEKMLARARKDDSENVVQWMQGDAQTLEDLDDDTFEVVTSCFALMDIPDLAAVYASVKRVLKPNGRFVFAITHPCFESPHSELLHTDAQFDGRKIMHYAKEGYWQSTLATGIRGQVGAHHRTLSTYVNGLIQQGFVLGAMSEPTFENANPDDPYREMLHRMPVVLVIEAIRM